MNPEVTSYIDKLGQPWQIELAQQLRQAVHTAVPEVDERIQYSKPHFTKNKKYLAVIGPAKGWVSFTLFNASGIEYDLFEASDVTERKTIKYKPGQTVDTAAVLKLIEAAAQGL